MFCATVRLGTRLNSWNTIPIPAAFASWMELRLTGEPLTEISPASLPYTPCRIFIRVDLPAPLPPASAWISPRTTSKSTPLSTTLPSKLFLIPVIWMARSDWVATVWVAVVWDMLAPVAGLARHCLKDDCRSAGAGSRYTFCQASSTLSWVTGRALRAT